ncbi:MAG: GntR family transcriptional regulator [Veillonellales bacterium]
MFDIRYFLEAGALEFAIPKLAESNIKRAEAILDEADQESLGCRWDGLNWQFHQAIYQVGERPRLLSLIQTMHNNVRRYMRLYLITLHYQAKAQKEHRDLLFACKHGEVEAAKKILRLHTKEAAELLAAYLEKPNMGQS